MKLDRFIRVSLALLIVLVFVIAIAALLFVTESALNVWDRLVQGPKLLLYAYLAAMVALATFAAWLIWRLVWRRKPAAATLKPAENFDHEDITKRLRDAEAAGVDVSEAQNELRELAARQDQKAIHLCFFGEVSTGKSSLIRALAPNAEVEIDVVGGSTTDVRHYRWRATDATGRRRPRRRARSPRSRC